MVWTRPNTRLRSQSGKNLTVLPAVWEFVVNKDRVKVSYVRGSCGRRPACTDDHSQQRRSVCCSAHTHCRQSVSVARLFYLHDDGVSPVKWLMAECHAPNLTPVQLPTPHSHTCTAAYTTQSHLYSCLHPTVTPVQLPTPHSQLPLSLKATTRLKSTFGLGPELNWTKQS